MSRKVANNKRALIAVPALAAGLLALGGPSSFGQAVPRVTTSVEGSSLVTLAGNTHPLAQARYDRGLAPASMTGRMLLLLKRSPEQQAQLDQLIADQQNPASPNFHKWLSPAQFGQQFGVADADLQSVSAYLASQGFNVGRVFSSKGAIEVSGTAAQIRNTFRTEIHQYAVNGQTFYANNADPRIPAALAPVVAGFASLNNFRISSAQNTQPATLDRTAHSARPLFDVPGGTTYAVTPGDLATIYNIPAATSYGNGGRGVAIGVVGDSNINLSYINNYRSTFSLPANTPNVIIDGNDPGVTNDAYVAYKQLEVAGAVAPNATLNYYTSATTDYDTGLDFAIIRAVEDNSVQVLAIGFQSCETNMGGSIAFLNLVWEQAAAQGMTVVAAAGNTGSAGCDVPGLAGAASNGLAVNGYASSPFVTAVGGTDFYYANANAYGTYWTKGSTQYSTAKSYIPEQAWNDSNLSTDAAPGTQVLMAGGGGLSKAGVDGIAVPTPQPSYQIGIVPGSISSTIRVLPDVAFFAGSGANNTTGYNNTSYLFCMADSDCKSGTPQFTVSGGTEASSAVFAGAMALVVGNQISLRGGSYPANQNIGVGNANPVLYNFVKKGAGVYHDVTIGSNKVQCTSKNCSGGYMTGYAAGAGFDAATGLGSFDITSLVANWSSAVPNTTGTSTSLSITDPKTGLPVTTVQHSAPVQFGVQVAGNGNAPTGDVAIYTNSPLAASAGQEVLTLTPGVNGSGVKVGQAIDGGNILLPGGTYQISARYAGDVTFAPSVSAAATFTVTPEASTMIIYGHNVNPSGSTIPYGSPVQITVEPFSAADKNNVSIPSGSVQVLDGSSVITSLPLNSEGATTFSSNLLNFGSHSIVLKYLGDASFTGSQTSAFNFSVTSAATQTVLNPSTQNVGVGGNNADGLTAVVKSATLPSNGTSPTGTVTFSTATPKTAPLVAGFDPNGNAISTASITIAPSDVPGSGVLSATYNPSGSNYSGSTSPQVPITATQSQYSGTSTVSFTLTDNNGTYQEVPGLSFPTNDSLVMNINVNTDTPDASYVTVYANGTAISGQLIPDANGNVAFTIPRQNGYLQLPSGQVQFTVQYDGWEEYLFGFDPIYQSPPASTNLSVTIIDNRTSADFSLQSNITTNQQNPLTAAAPAANYQLLLTSIYNFQSAYATTPINLTCSIPNNPGLQCSFSATAVTLGGSGFATSTLTVGPAPGNSIAGNTLPQSTTQRWWIAGGGATLACMFLFGIPDRRRRWQSLLGVIALVLISGGVSGCASRTASEMGLSGSANGNPSGTNGSVTPNATTVQPGVYTVVVTATTSTNTTIVHNLPVSVVVTNQ